MTQLAGRSPRRQRRRQKWLFWGIVSLLLAYGLFGGDHRPHHLLLLALEERQTEARIELLAQRNAELVEKHDQLAQDPFTLESLAREKGLIRPGDLVYHIIPVPPGVHEAGAESLAARAARAAFAAADSAADSMLPAADSMFPVADSMLN
ncbi:MAG TPA: septum formation initiator family protein [Gemmatimonadota bacterium]|nr:septum formation initiator family protein [Gemmatimonadota bacterium]